MTSSTFPVTYSTLACDALVSRVLPYFQLADVIDCKLWHRGLSDVYLVETATRLFVLRVSHAHWRTKSEIDFELELLIFLQQREIPVARPLRTMDGQLSIEIEAPEGKRYAALFDFAPGQVPLGDLSSSQGQKLGETIGRLHQVATDFHSRAYRQPLTLDYLLDDSLEAIAPFLQDRPQDHEYLIDIISEVKKKLQDMPKDPPFWSVCWGDPHSGNVHFTDDNQVTLFDFDQCGHGWRAFELAKFLHVSARTGMQKQVRNAFLEGYKSVQTVTTQEEDSIQPFSQAAHIWQWSIGLKSAKVHDNCRLDNSYFNQRIQQLKMLSSPEWELF
ncbi:phosphotransferase [Acaryochloris sp. IP29b_bin.137]|uniref:phosphotransferase enzyme family protein n=1 Tax=Acaryochloris sp. IP29b_bin.137 TaxID=2969217 RepID=UPI0026268FAE|nr:phosphotransferase [Acaryochloris sp. IP29b_bin.137]